jgi:para-aminobenzoate synthetase component 2
VTRVLVIDNYDSFVYNLVQYLGELGAEQIVHRHDAITLEQMDEIAPDAVLISPGPGRPSDAGLSNEAIRHFGERGVPVLGVCLGLQCIGELYGGNVVRAPHVMHGKTSEITHSGVGLFAGLPSPFTATRYHSLAVEGDALPPEIVVTGRTPSGVVMSLRHESLPIEGVQFHPESVLTQGGHHMVANWLRVCGGEVDDELVARLGAEVETMRAAAFAGV